MKNAKKLFWFLSIVLIGIWGTIAYQIVSAVRQGDEDDTQMTLFDKKKGETLALYHYEDDTRDPFRFYIAVKKDSMKKTITHPLPIIWTPPPYRLTGIIMNDRMKTALLEGQDGSVSFLRQGDSVAGIQILNINEKQVVYSYHKRKSEWTLQ